MNDDSSLLQRRPSGPGEGTGTGGAEVSDRRLWSLSSSSPPAASARRTTVGMGVAPGGSASGSDADHWPVTTDSGLLLTHRRTPSPSAASSEACSRSRRREDCDDNGGPRGRGGSGGGRSNRSINFVRPSPSSSSVRSSPMTTSLSAAGRHDGQESSGSRNQRILRLSRAWTAALLVSLGLCGAVAVHTARHEERVRAMARTRAGTGTGAAAVEGEIWQEPTTASRSSSSSSSILQPPPRRRTAVAAAEEETEPASTLGGGGGRKNGAHGDRQGRGHGGHFPHGKHERGAAHGGRHHNHKRHGWRQHYDEGVLDKLQTEFEAWADKHKRKYGSHEERERRFGIWVDNHHRTIEKNERHGPCKMTNKKVFGDNHFKDLTTEEFKARYLTGYGGPRTDELPERHRDKRRTDEVVPPLPHQRRASPSSSAEPVGSEQRQKQSRPTKEASPNPLTAAERHPAVQRKYEESVRSQTESGSSLADALRWIQDKTYIDHWERTTSSGYSDGGGGCSGYGKTYYHRERGTNCYRSEVDSNASRSGFSWYKCRWWDVSCWLRVIFTGSAYGGSSEPTFNGDNYPSSIDWREMGAVTQVHSQGQCGACWAITAVETIESASFIRTGTLYDLAESEVIVCDKTCALCEGGWPQNAYDYVMKWNGLPEEYYWQYNDYWLLSLTYYATGESDELNEADVSSYLYSQCPTGNWMSYGGDGSGSQHSGSGSGDNNNEFYYESDYLSSPRYGQIKDYAYSTDRCVCYTDGTGCDCDDQNEKRALMNVASYGPATVCLDASVWQDYDGGILTSSSGCSSQFLDMNHCVQAVGYAFTDGSEEGEEGQDFQRQLSGNSGSHSGSRDDADRVGYWIIRNQWSENWGMYGYIYVAMGENTCGVLNDMTQAFA